MRCFLFNVLHDLTDTIIQDVISSEHWGNIFVHNVLLMSIRYRLGTVNSKSFVGKDFLQIKWKFELINAL